MAKKVYLIRAAQFYKIGISENPESRIKQVQTGCPIKCEYIGYFPTIAPVRLEKELHGVFLEFKTYGEWFDLGDDHIEIMINEYNLKWVANPLPEITDQSEKATKGNELMDARSISSKLVEFDKLYSEVYDGYCLSSVGKSKVRRLLTKYGSEIVNNSFIHLSQKLDYNQSIDKMNSTCKTLQKYGRHISDGVWFLYINACREYDSDIGNSVISFIMDNELDMDEAYMKVIISDIHTYQMEETGKEFLSNLRFVRDELNFERKQSKLHGTEA